MKSYRWVIISSIASLLIAGISYLWATTLMDSLYAYRSPFANQPLENKQPTAEPLARRVVTIVVDGLRVDTASQAEVMPFLNSLRAQGASATIHSRVPSYSAPSWSVQATGAWPDISDGPAMNPTSYENYIPWTQDTIYSSLHRAGLRSAIASHEYFNYLVPPQHFDAFAWTKHEDHAADLQNTAAAVEFIASDQFHYIYTHLLQLDYAGHYEGGPLDPRWNQAANRVDKLIEEISASLDLTRDTMLIYSDHGQIDQGGHGGQDAIVTIQPFIMVGANVRPGDYGDIQQVDIAPTTTFLLGANLPALSQGRPLTNMLTLSSAQLATIREALVSQQDNLFRAYAAVNNSSVATPVLNADQDAVTVYQSAIQEIKDDRLNRDRLLRFAWVAPLALLPLIAAFRKRGRVLAWFILAALVYRLTFHLFYAVLNGGTYTLSTVLGASNLITSIATYTILSYLVTWLLTMIVLRWFRLPRLQAVHQQIAFSAVILYFTALPALWSLAYNGALVGWTLPDIGSFFYGFLSILQMLFIAVITLPFMGLAALIAKRPRSAIATQK
jgi:hypothetical protein